MRLIIFSCIIFAALVFSHSTYADRMNFTEKDIASAFRTNLEIKLVKNGLFPDFLSLSSDGTRMAFTLLTRDTNNNELFFMKSDGSDLVRVKVPYGFKGVPNLSGGYLYFNFTAKDIRRSKGLRNARYRVGINQPVVRIQFLYSNFLPYARFNQTEVFRPVQHRNGIGIEMIYPDGKLKRSFYLSFKLRKNVRGVYLDRDKRYFYVLAFDTSSGSYPPDVNIYRFENRAKAEGEIVVKNALSPTIGLTYATKRALLFSHVNKGNIYEYDTDSGNTRILIECKNGFYCREPTFNPAKDVFYFIAQYKTEKIALFEAKWTRD